MKQVFEHYEKWEDYQAGMYEMKDVSNEDEKVNNAVLLLSSETDFFDTLTKLVQDWQIATAVNLTNKGQNRRAWLGAAACMYKYQTPEYLTRIAWNLLDSQTQHKANLVAEKIINIFEQKTNLTHVKTLF